MKLFENLGQSFKDFDKSVLQNIRFKETFETRETTYSSQILFRDQKVKYFYAYDSNKYEVLGKISMMKAHLRRLPEKVLNKEKIYSKDIKYFQFSNNVNDIKKHSGEIFSFTNVLEIDLSAAYFHAALEMEILSKELFEKIIYKGTDENGNFIYRDKGDRLKILGSMAVRTYVNEYHKGKKINTKIETNEQFRNLWFHICKRVDDLFQRVIRKIPKKDFYFYFVDGIYVQNFPETVYFIQECFEKENFPYKKILINKFEVVNKNGFIFVELEKSNGKIKKFIVPQREIKYYYIN